VIRTLAYRLAQAQSLTRLEWRYRIVRALGDKLTPVHHVAPVEVEPAEVLRRLRSLWGPETGNLLQAIRANLDDAPAMNEAPCWDQLPGKEAWPHTPSHRIDLHGLAATRGDVRHIWNVGKVWHWPHLAVHDQHERLREEWRTFIDRCPVGYGVQWAPELEAAERALNWMVTLALLDTPAPDEWRAPIQALLQHGAFLHKRMTRWSWNHCIGEASVLAMLATLAPEPLATRWRTRAVHALTERCATLIDGDGAYGERSPTYSFLVWQYLTLALPSLPHETQDALKPRVRALGVSLAALAHRDGTLPHLGDADDAVLLTYPPRPIALHEHPAWTQPTEDVDSVNTVDGIRALPGYGVTRCTKGRTEVLLKWDNPPSRDGASPHVHDDVLQALVRFDGEDVLLDGGTYSYTEDPTLRAALRDARGHNAPRIEGPSSGVSLSTFRWRRIPRGVALEQGTRSPYLVSGRREDGLAERHILTLEEGLVLIADRVMKPSETSWRMAQSILAMHEHSWSIGTHQAHLWMQQPGEVQIGERTTSLAYGERFEAPTLEVGSAGGWQALLIAQGQAETTLSATTEDALTVTRGSRSWQIILSGSKVMTQAIEAVDRSLA